MEENFYHSEGNGYVAVDFHSFRILAIMYKETLT